MASDHEAARILRGLADTIQRRSEARSLPGISCPKIKWFGNGHELTGYGDNPTLLAAIADEIRISWPELRERALQRLDDSIGQQTAQAISALAGADPASPTPTERSGTP